MNQALVISVAALLLCTAVVAVVLFVTTHLIDTRSKWLKWRKTGQQALALPINVYALRVAGRDLLAVPPIPVPHVYFDVASHACPRLDAVANAGDLINVTFSNPNSVDVHFVTGWLFEYGDGLRDMVTMRGTVAAGKFGAFARPLPRGGALVRIIMSAVAQ